MFAPSAIMAPELTSWFFLFMHGVLLYLLASLLSLPLTLLERSQPFAYTFEPVANSLLEPVSVSGQAQILTGFPGLLPPPESPGLRLSHSFTLRSELV